MRLGADSLNWLVLAAKLTSSADALATREQELRDFAAVRGGEYDG
jgi:hypothetical protein